MQLYLIRHALPLNPTDKDPPLSERGMAQARMLEMLFATIRIKPTSARIITSHLQRAHQTAVCIFQGIGVPSNEVLIWPTENDWMPISDFQTRFIELLRKITEEEEPSEVVVVGHFNYLNDTLAWEVGQDAVSLPDAYGAIACLTCKPSFEKGSGMLDWLMVPYPPAQS